MFFCSFQMRLTIWLTLWHLEGLFRNFYENGCRYFHDQMGSLASHFLCFVGRVNSYIFPVPTYLNHYCVPNNNSIIILGYCEFLHEYMHTKWFVSGMSINHVMFYVLSCEIKRDAKSLVFTKNSLVQISSAFCW